MDALKDRVGGFTECTLTMACPVLLAVATKKVDLSLEGNAGDRRSIVPLAYVTLFLCPIAFFPLGFVIARRSINQAQGQAHLAPAPNEEQNLLRLCTLGWTKLLVHVSAMSQMFLARTIFHLITMHLGASLLAILILACLVVAALCVWSVPVRIAWHREADEAWEAADGCWWHKKLELSLDLSAAVTSLLFLGLEGLALEGQTSGLGNDLVPSLRTPVGIAFGCCVLASVVTAVATVPPIDRSGVAENHAGSARVRAAMDVICALLAVGLAAVVTTILVFLVYNNEKAARIKAAAATVIPSFALFLIYLYFLSRPGGGGTGTISSDQLKPASLEMTKVIFTAFLAISLPSFRGYHLSSRTSAFIVTAAVCVVFGIGWRLFSHIQQRAAVLASKAACLCTNACLAAAAIELLVMAKQSLPHATSS